ncbi:hypothetical protein QYM36_019245 [Artemia franciscana]|uniref:Uncharacterized protein n=1 Tax=Artemia franciscana TaxID=6661 RepID=A0AA88H1F4_ARTSF|nr:hypothetical protein QYM36_019245 [Artemia franciscana]
MGPRFYGLAHHCDILIPEPNVETYLNQEHKKKKMNEQNDVAGIFLTSTPEAIMYTALFYGLAHHCDILIPELNVETHLNQEHKKKKMNEQKDVAGIFVTSTPEAIMYTAFDKELRDNLKIHDLIEAISRATTRATIVYTNGDQLLSGIAQQFKEHTPQIMPEGG